MDNYIIIIFCVMAAAVIGFTVFKFTKSSKQEKINIIKHWLLYAVAIAEKELGGGTGKLKLAQVYNAFITELPALANFISFEYFSQLVDEVLVEFRHMIETNADINSIINNEKE